MNRVFPVSGHVLAYGLPRWDRSEECFACGAHACYSTAHWPLKPDVGGGPHPDKGDLGIVDNDVRLSRFGVTLYSLRERYELNSDGRRVPVVAHERFGPIARILSRSFSYPAEIRSDGLGSTYHMPLLGSPWIATYEVGADRRSLAGTLRCDWAMAEEYATGKASNT